MTRPPVKAKKLARSIVQVTGIDERNFAELPIILGQKIIPGDLRLLERRILTSSGQTIIMVLKGQDRGLPHGLDNDIWLAIQQLYREQGSPPNGRVTFTAYGLLSKVGLDSSGQYYDNLVGSLARLSETTCQITSGYYSVATDREVAVNFTPLSAVVRTYSRQGTEERAQFEVTINQFTTASIIGNYVKPLNLERSQSFQQPFTRVLYRLLDAKLYRLKEASQQAGRPTARLEFIESVKMWGALAGLLDEAPSKIRRALASPHADLLAQGYLKSVEYLGRGEHQTVHYVFNTERDVDEELVTQLTRHGLTQRDARLWLSRLGVRVDAVLKRLTERQVAAGPKIDNVTGYLKTMLRSEEEAMLNEAELSASDLIVRTKGAGSSQVNAPKKMAPQPLLEIKREALPLDVEIRTIMSMLKVQKITPHLSAAQLQAIEGAMQVGRVAVSDISSLIASGRYIGRPEVEIANQLIEQYLQF